MVKMRKCKNCGLLFETKSKKNIFCSYECRSSYKLNKGEKELKICVICNNRFNAKTSRHIYCSAECRRLGTKNYRIKVLKRIAGKSFLKCVICGCPYIEALTIGHFNSDGKKHRENLKKEGVSIYTWVLKTPIKQVRKKVQLECAYCQYYFTWTGIYPPENKRPKWT